MKLAYIPFDARKLKFYMDELVSLDDLFLLSYYSGLSLEILRDPDENGWVCESHVVILHRDQIIDPASGESRPAFDHWCNGCHTKRIFRVVRLPIHEAYETKIRKQLIKSLNRRKSNLSAPIFRDHGVIKPLYFI